MFPVDWMNWSKIAKWKSMRRSFCRFQYSRGRSGFARCGWRLPSVGKLSIGCQCDTSDQSIQLGAVDRARHGRVRRYLRFDAVRNSRNEFYFLQIRLLDLVGGAENSKIVLFVKKKWNGKASWWEHNVNWVPRSTHNNFRAVNHITMKPEPFDSS